MTTKDFTIKWLVYALAFLPLWFLQDYVLSRLSLCPMLLPLCVVAVAVLEGAVGGAGFGLAVGVIYDSTVPGVPGAMILVMTLLGLGMGLLARYILRQDFVGCFFCSALSLLLLDALRIGERVLMNTAPLSSMLSLAGREILWSLCFVPLVYWVFRWVFQRVPKATVL